jgi:hypothetical protein
MNKSEITDAISAAFGNLADLSAQVYDYWISELYDLDDNMIEDNWNVQNLKLMEDDVMNLSLVNEDV